MESNFHQVYYDVKQAEDARKYSYDKRPGRRKKNPK